MLLRDLSNNKMEKPRSFQAMTRTYMRKTQIVKWEKCELRSAMNLIKETVKGVAEIDDIPRTTLITRMKKNDSDKSKRGRYSTSSGWV